MRVAMLSDCYLPRLGGIEVQVHDLSRRLIERGHQVEVFTITPGDDDAIDGVPVHRHGLRLPRGLLINPLAARAVRRELRRFDVAHIHIGVLSPFAWDMARAVTADRIPATMTWHSVLDRAEQALGWVGQVKAWADAGVAMNAVSDIAAEPVRRLTQAPVQVLPNGIDVQAWRPTGRPFGDDGICRFVSAMRLERRKRPVELIQMIARVRAAAPSVAIRLEILGEGNDRDKVERAVSRVGGEAWVSLPGRVPRADLLARYAQSDVYVSPAILESFGIAALEARCAGLPVVGRAGSGIEEFVTDDVNGYLAADDDELVRRLTAFAVHPSLRRRMTEQNLRTDPAQGWERVLLTAEAEYSRAIEANRPR